MILGPWRQNPSRIARPKPFVTVEMICKAHKLPAPVSEHRFDATRKWRLDYAWLAQMVALEIEGGLFIQGRHSRGAGMVKDMEKYNAAQLAGWVVLRCTPSQVSDGSIAALLQQALG